MPVAREKDQRRTASTSSEGPSSTTPPTRFFPNGAWDPNDHDGGRSVAGAVSQCCSPKCTVMTDIDPASPEPDSVKMICSNEKCIFSSFMHATCFSSFEEQMLSCLRGMSRARNWPEKQRRQNLWTKKGYDLIYKMSTCRCLKGALRRDLSFTGVEDKAGKRKRKKSTSSEKVGIPVRSVNGVQRSRSRTSGRSNSDSFSSENGTSYMQPFAHRSDYSIFDKVMPRHLINSYHIKMEDDGYGAGDDTRSFVLSSLAFHHTSHVDCILCSASMSVYDQFPLIDGTFFLSPVKPAECSLEVEGKGDDPSFLSAVCLHCLVGVNRVSCKFCFKLWNGNHHQIGTMYTYNILASFPCCGVSLQCNRCCQPLADPSKIQLSFSQLSSQVKCSQCGSMDYHYIKPLSHFSISKGH